MSLSLRKQKKANALLNDPDTRWTTETWMNVVDFYLCQAITKCPNSKQTQGQSPLPYAVCDM